MAKPEKVFAYKTLFKDDKKVGIQPLAIVPKSDLYTQFLPTIPAKERKHINFFLTHKSSLKTGAKKMTLKQAIKEYGVQLKFKH